MNKTQVSIEKIALHSKGISPDLARSALDGLGQEVAKNLAQQSLIQPRQTIQLGDLNLGTLTLTRSHNPSELRKEIARAVTDAIAARIERR